MRKALSSPAIRRQLGVIACKYPKIYVRLVNFGLQIKNLHQHKTITFNDLPLPARQIYTDLQKSIENNRKVR